MTDSPGTPCTGRKKSVLESLMGLLRIRIIRGVNLAVRDVRSSDPYVVVKMGKQKLKTRVIHRDVNLEWHEDLTISIIDPNLPVLLIVYDHDLLSKDDKMGDAELDIRPYIDAVRMKPENLPNGTVITKIQPNRDNFLSQESCITVTNGRVLQDLCLRLRNVECGELELQLQWIDLPGSKGLS